MRLSPGEEAASYYKSAKESYALGHYKTALDLAKQAVYASSDWPEAYTLYYFCNLRVSSMTEGKAAEEYKNAAEVALSNLKRICANKGLTPDSEMAKFFSEFPDTKSFLESIKKKAAYPTYAVMAFATILAFWAGSSIMKRG